MRVEAELLVLRHRGEADSLGLRDAIDLIEREPEGLAHVADGRAGPVADHLADHPGPVAAVLLVDVLDHLLAPLVLEVHVDVGRLAALGGDEALEEEPHPHRIDRGDAEDEADRRVRGASPPLA